MRRIFEWVKKGLFYLKKWSPKGDKSSQLYEANRHLFDEYDQLDEEYLENAEAISGRKDRRCNGAESGTEKVPRTHE